MSFCLRPVLGQRGAALPFVHVPSLCSCVGLRTGLRNLLRRRRRRLASLTIQEDCLVVRPSLRRLATIFETSSSSLALLFRPLPRCAFLGHGLAFCIHCSLPHPNFTQ